MTDFRAAAGMLKGKTVKIDTFVVPATSEIARGLKTETIERPDAGGDLPGGRARRSASRRAPRAWAGRATPSAG